MEFGAQPFLVNVPRQVADEKVGRRSFFHRILRLRLLLLVGRGLLVGLALLVVLGGLFFVRVRAVGVIGVVGVVGVVRLVRGFLA